MKTRITLAMVVCLLLTFSTSALAQDNGFEDLFDSPELAGWEHSQDVIVSGGILSINPGNFAFRNGEFSEISLEITLRHSQPGSIMIHYYATDQGAYDLHFLENEIMLDKIHNEQPTLLGSADYAGLPQNEWVTVKIVFQNQQHQISIGDELIISAQDDDPLNPGAIGIVVHGESPAEFDSIKLSGTGTVAAIAPAEPGQEEAGNQPPVEEPAPPGEPQTAAAAQQTPAASIETRANLLDQLFTTRADPLALQTFTLNLVLSAVLAFILGRVYIYWGSSLSNRRKFAANFMLMTVTTTFIILVVRSSVALSLGLVGALSIVRFRTAIKDPEELAYLFFSIGIGIGLGDNQRLITLLAFVIAILLLGLVKLTRKAHADANLNLTIASHNPHKVGLEEAMRALEPHCAKIKLLRFDETRDVAEMAFILEFKHLNNLTAAKQALHLLSEDIEITFIDNKGIW